ncbi:MAG: metallopeptidase TldD-related protein [Thermoleophilia bacterium]|nr:metallopeptidase TldD-related protein [Thermoleophilia bacterium]
MYGWWTTVSAREGWPPPPSTTKACLGGHFPDRRGRAARLPLRYVHGGQAGGGTESTGNAARGSYRGGPGVAPSNLVLDAGEGTLDDLLARVGEGIYIVGVTGLHSGANAVTGEFSVGATGHLIAAGVRTRPVREVTIASDLLSLLANVADLAGDSRWIPFGGSVLTPSVAIAGVTVSGT